jgi:hypothetical protein
MDVKRSGIFAESVNLNHTLESGSPKNYQMELNSTLDWRDRPYGITLDEVPVASPKVVTAEDPQTTYNNRRVSMTDTTSSILSGKSPAQRLGQEMQQFKNWLRENSKKVPYQASVFSIGDARQKPDKIIRLQKRQIVKNLNEATKASKREFSQFVTLQKGVIKSNETALREVSPIDAILNNMRERR